MAVKADLRQQLLAELGFDRPQVGRLADEGGAVDAGKSGEPVAVVAAEVLVQALVGVDAQQLADALDGQHLTVGQDRVGAALAEPPAAQPLVDQTVHGDEQRRSIHARPPYALVMASPRSVRGSQPTETRTPG
jgi:hypothetical protein